MFVLSSSASGNVFVSLQNKSSQWIKKVTRMPLRKSFFVWSWLDTIKSISNLNETHRRIIVQIRAPVTATLPFPINSRASAIQSQLNFNIGFQLNWCVIIARVCLGINRWMNYFGLEDDAVLESLVGMERNPHVEFIIGHHSVILFGQHDSMDHNSSSSSTGSNNNYPQQQQPKMATTAVTMFHRPYPAPIHSQQFNPLTQFD